MNITPVQIVNVNKKAVENHTERYSSFDEGAVTVDSDSEQQTVSEKCESETTGSPRSMLDLNVSLGTSNSDVSEEIIVNDVEPMRPAWMNDYDVSFFISSVWG
jgi:hypothetical protein